MAIPQVEALQQRLVRVWPFVACLFPAMLGAVALAYHLGVDLRKHRGPAAYSKVAVPESDEIAAGVALVIAVAAHVVLRVMLSDGRLAAVARRARSGAGVVAA